MSDIVERARDRAGMLPSVDHVESALLLEAAAEIERLRAEVDGRRKINADFIAMLLSEEGVDSAPYLAVKIADTFDPLGPVDLEARQWKSLLSLSQSKCANFRSRAATAEAQRDALLKAAEPIIAESSREDRDDYRVRVKTADIRALAAAVAGARPEINEGEDNA